LRTEADARALVAHLAAVYDGEFALSVGLGGLDVVSPAAATAVVESALALVPADARVELRSLRRPLRRELLHWSRDVPTAVVVVAARRKLVLQTAIDGVSLEPRRQLGFNRRRMLRLVERDGGHCVWCSTPLTHTSLHATVDHIHCRSHGGGDALDNLVLACVPCNNKRSNSPAEAWLETCLRNGRSVDLAAVHSALARLPQAA
jgi:5-methylcytosine-specific restriction endonuclease McrA